MTRETRIGLLVGLVFIVMFGLVLTELTGAGTNSDPSAATPTDQTALVWSPQPEDVSPSVVTAGSPEAVAAAPPADPSAPPIALTAEYTAITAPPEVAPDTAAALPDSVEPLETIEVAVVEPPPVTRLVETAPVIHTVAKGDTLYGIAARHYGKSNAHQHRLISQANVKLLGPKNMLQIGQVLVIPPLPQASAKPAETPNGKAELVDLDQLRGHLEQITQSVAPAAAAPGSSLTAVEQPKGAKPKATTPVKAAVAPATQPGKAIATIPAKPAAAGKTYTVKRGDSLTRIAAVAMKDKAGARKIFEANRDKLKSPDALKEGMTLAIPQ